MGGVMKVLQLQKAGARAAPQELAQQSCTSCTTMYQLTVQAARNPSKGWTLQGWAAGHPQGPIPISTSRHLAAPTPISTPCPLQCSTPQRSPRPGLDVVVLCQAGQRAHDGGVVGDGGLSVAGAVKTGRRWSESRQAGQD